MDDQDKGAFATCIGALLETFGQEATKPILHGYWLGLQDLSLTDVQLAVAIAIRSCERQPRPVELRRLVGEKTDDQRSIAAWNDVLKAIPRGAYKHIDFQDKLVNAAIRTLGGWPTFLERLTGAEAEKWARLDFMKAYSAFAAGGVDGEVCNPLAGLSQGQVVDGEVVAPIPLLIECEADRAKPPMVSRIADLRNKILNKAESVASSVGLTAGRRIPQETTK